MANPSTGRFYGRGKTDPVPFPAYRCRATATEQRPDAPHSTLTHRCRTEVDHSGDHTCICGKEWAPGVLTGPNGANG
ncbi:hypothetical protein [Microbacterium sp. NPDC089188]|uniref:hypothetical protein n=1 Tax=Microbacterium sp. NPDC089188 TaxID=3154971 RepID=UPI003420EA7D